MQIGPTTWPLVMTLRHAGPLRRLRGWNRLLSGLFPPERQSEWHFDVPFDGGLRYSGRADNLLDWWVLFYGAYEGELLALLASHAVATTGCVFLDAGANVGHHALFMAQHCAAVHAVEPNPDLWSRIEGGARRNRIDNIFLHRVALGEQEGRLPFYPPAGVNAGTGSLIASAEGVLAEPITVPVRRGDDLLIEADVRRVDLVKLDVQGFEPQALLGLRGTLERDRPLIVVEVSADNRDAFSVHSRLLDFLPAGYGLSHHRRRGLLTHRFAEEPLPESALREYDGNVICRPLSGVAPPSRL